MGLSGECQIFVHSRLAAAWHPGEHLELHFARGLSVGIVGLGNFTFFDAHDVVRHPLVQRIVRAYEARSK